MKGKSKSKQRRLKRKRCVVKNNSSDLNDRFYILVERMESISNALELLTRRENMPDVSTWIMNPRDALNMMMGEIVAVFEEALHDYYEGDL